MAWLDRVGNDQEKEVRTRATCGSVQGTCAMMSMRPLRSTEWVSMMEYWAELDCLLVLQDNTMSNGSSVDLLVNNYLLVYSNLVARLLHRLRAVSYWRANYWSAGIPDYPMMIYLSVVLELHFF